MTLVGLDYLGKQEIERHNKATEAIAIGDRLSREQIASADRSSREGIASLDRISREGIASLDRASRETIASADRSSRESIARDDRISRENVASLDRLLRQDIADKDRSSRENIAQADRDVRVSIADADRNQRHLDSRYNTDAGIMKSSNIKDVVATQLAKDWFLSGTYGNPVNDMYTLPGLDLGLNQGQKGAEGTIAGPMNSADVARKVTEVLLGIPKIKLVRSLFNG